MTMTDTKNPDDNLSAWSFLSKTDPNFTKPITGKRFNGTAINPTYCYKKMTEQYGPCGIGWYYEIKETITHPAPEGQLLLFVCVHVYISDPDAVEGWSAPIPGFGGNLILAAEGAGDKRKIFVDDEAYKKATTDALTNALKFLGMSADIHTGMYDDNKYLNTIKQEFGEGKFHEEAPAPAAAAPLLPSEIFSSPDEKAAWPTATPEKQLEMYKAALVRRVDWMKQAVEHLKAFVIPEDVVRWKSSKVAILAALSDAQRAAMNEKVAERVRQLSQAPLTTAAAPASEWGPDELPGDFSRPAGT